MNLICRINGHKWYACKCQRCGEVREGNYHLWNACHGRCPVCGATRPPEHTWVGCKCKLCGATRDEAHDWDLCRGVCRTCGKTQPEEHRWNGCKCTACGRTRDEGHNWNGCKCTVCGQTRGEGHNWKGIRCTICGKFRELPAADRACLADYEEGDGIVFGRWRDEELIWQVLAVEEDRMLLITARSIAGRAFNKSGPGTWDVSSLREELNGDWFYLNPKVFTDAERAAILPETHDSPGISYQNKRNWSQLYTQGGGEAEDHVFLLSVAEACRYFHVTKEDWQKDGMGYNTYMFPISEDLSFPVSWWLRNSTRSQAAAVNVLTYGMINYNGYTVSDSSSVGVRPAMWISRKAKLQADAEP